MKELEEIMMNIGAVQVESGELKPQGEVVLVYSEPHYRRDEKGALVSVRHLHELRLGMGPGRMRQFARGLMGAADTLEREFERALGRMAGSGEDTGAPSKEVEEA